jgi:hypothetical protein
VRRLAAALLSLLLFVAALPSAASAGEIELTGLHVEGPVWRADNLFAIKWKGNILDTLGYRFLNVPWEPREVASGEWPDSRAFIQIPAPPGGGPPPPGEYQLEMWLWKNGVSYQRGPSSYVVLRYDDAPPAPPAAAAPIAWLDGRDPISATIGPPSADPLSVIGGYAVSISGRPGESPCAQPTRCGEAELTLPGAPGEQLLQLGKLPEGVNYLNVVAVSGTGVRSATTSVPIKVDVSAPAIRFAGIPGGWVDHPVQVTAVADDPFAGTEAAGPTGPFTALAVDGGAPTQSLGGSATTTVSGEGIHTVSGWGRDAIGNVGEAATAARATVRIDETPPRLAFANGQRPEDPELIEVAVSDALSGPGGDRGSIGVRPAGSSQGFQPLPTRTTGGGLAARWSSDDFPHGDYEFRATGFDAAGNVGVTERRADVSRMVLHNPIKIPTAVESGFGGAKLVWQHCHRVDGGRRCKREAVRGFDSRPALWTVPYGRSLGFGGILRTAAGAPIGGQRIEIVETFAPGADSAQRRTIVLSGADGRFDARLAPGPSRRVEAFFPGTGTLTRGSGRSVTMAVRAGLRLRASTRAAPIGGDPVIFSGRLLAGEADVPRTGRPIELQFRVPGGAWSEFRTVQTDRHGRFRYPYAFTDDDSRGIRFQFRAISPEQSDWPYRPSTSPPLAVTGY